MKLEKREITLNEKDSLLDVFYMQKTLIGEYLFALERATKKATRLQMISHLQAAAQDLSYIQELIEKTRIGEN